MKMKVKIKELKNNTRRKWGWNKSQRSKTKNDKL